MPKAVVSHAPLGRLYEGEVICAATARALKSLGYDVFLALAPGSSPCNAYGAEDYVRTLRPGPLVRALGSLGAPLAWAPVLKAVKEGGAELALFDNPYYGPLVKPWRGLTMFEYIYVPLEAVFLEKYRGLGLNYMDNPATGSMLPRGLAMGLYFRLAKSYMRENPFGSAALVLASSRWAAEVAKEVYGEAPKPLNPPLPHRPQKPQEEVPFEERDELVVMVGRFSEEKRYEWVVKSFGPWLKKNGIKLVIFGEARAQAQRRYLKKVLGGAKGISVGLVEPGAYKLSADRDVMVYPNASEELVHEAFERAKAFLSAERNPIWSFSVAEAMSMGLPALVHRSGGVWTDLVDEGRAGLGYEDAEEAKELLLRLVGDRRFWNSISYASKRRASLLTLEKFSEGLLELAKPL